MIAAGRFLAALDPDATGFCFQTFDDDASRKDKGLTRVLHGSLAQRSAELELLNARGAGVFVTVNATDGDGRKSGNITRVRAVFVDLDGAPLDPVLANGKPPHIVVESSPGKWHAYWRVAALPLGDFEPVQRALAAQFSGDPKVCDLPRVMRLPGFMHRKSEPFVSRIIETNARGPYSGDEFERPPPEPTSQRETDNRWSRLNSAALKNLSAWVPNLFGSNAVLRAGIYRVSSKALGRDLEEDLSISPAGIKDFGLHDQGDARDGKRTPIDVVREYGNKTFADAVDWLQGKLGHGVAFADFHAYMPQHIYIYAPTREPWPAASVNSRLPPVPLLNAEGKPLLDDKGKERYISASAWLDKNSPVEQMTWAPGEPLVIRDRLIADGGWHERAGVACLNLYRPPTIAHGNANEAATWCEHVRKAFPVHADHIIKYLAHRVQHPETKINHALVLGGEPGIGKDTILEPVRQAVGPWNFAEVSPSQLVGRFNGFIKSVIFRISEARDLGDVNRYSFYEHMKVFAASPPDVLRCDEKHLREHSVLNCCGVVITTNYKTDGIYLPANDRRHFVAWSDLKKEDFPDNYWNELWGWYRTGGYEHVAAYLAQFDLSSFDAKAPPPKTEAFWDIVNANRAPEDAELADIIDALGGPTAVTLEMLGGKASEEGRIDFSNWLFDRKNRRAIPHRLEQCGYVPVRNDSAKDGLYVIKGRRQAVYARSELSMSERQEAATAMTGAGGKQ